MNFLVATILALCAGFVVVQLCVLIPFIVRMRRSTRQYHRVEHWPKFFVAMPLRGADESLATAIRHVLDQDYPDFELRIVIDHESDPAWGIVHRVLKETNSNRVKVELLRERSESCSLVCSSLAQILDDLRDSEGLVAFCAGDMQPPRTWLREMASLLANPEVGSTLGNRWYLPPQGQWGSLVQYLWNAGAVVPMWMFQITWGGACALRLEDIRAADLANKWRHSMVEDATIKAAVQDLGKRLEFSPQLFVVDRGEISLPRACQFIYRQLLWTRLYHPHWFGVVMNAVATTAFMLAPFVAALVAFICEEVTIAAQLVTIGIAYVFASEILAIMIHRTIRATLEERGEHGDFSLLHWVKIFFAIPITQVIYATAMLFATFADEVSWRGVRYKLTGPWNVRMLEYSPYNSGKADEATV